jgi:tRNA nucleotidyltransferase/poly(A) polymerase
MKKITHSDFTKVKIFESFLDSYINESRNFKSLIPSSVIELAKAFEKKGFTLNVVGGAVRDFLMKKTPKDYDLATNAEPKDTEKIVNSLGFKTLEVGKQFGIVVSIDPNGDEYEIATFREDLGYTDSNRRPDGVKFTTIEGDVKRRDLTMNALFYDIANDQIVDLVGGEYDIKTGTIRTVGEPKERFDEDPLRKIRAIRFYARSGKRFAIETEKSLRMDTSIKDVSSERLYEEFKKGLEQAEDPQKFTETLYDFGYLEHFFPKLELYTKDFINSKSSIIQAAWLLQNEDPKNIEPALLKAKWSVKNKEIPLIVWFVKTLSEDYSDVYNMLRKRDQNDFVKFSSLIKEWISLFPKKKEWINRVMSFDLAQINMDDLLDGVPNHKRPEKVKEKIKELW